MVGDDAAVFRHDFGTEAGVEIDIGIGGGGIDADLQLRGIRRYVDAVGGAAPEKGAGSDGGQAEVTADAVCKQRGGRRPAAGAGRADAGGERGYNLASRGE